MITAKTKKIIKIDWLNIIIENILYGKYSQSLINHNNKLFKLIYNKFKFSLKDYKNILSFFDFNNVSYMINNGFYYYLFLPHFLNKLNLSYLILDYYNNDFYIGINDLQTFDFKKHLITYTKPSNIHTKYNNIISNIKQNPDFIIINKFITNNNYTDNIDFINFIPKLNNICKFKNYNLLSNDLIKFKKTFNFNNYNYILNNIILDNDNRIINNIDKNIQVNVITYIYVKQNKTDNISFNDNSYDDIINIKNDNKKLNSFIKHMQNKIKHKSNIIKKIDDKKIIKLIKYEINNLKNNLNDIITLKLNISKNEYISLIKKFYPYYTYLNKYNKKQLQVIYNRICKNISIKNDQNNSCYLDSLLIALFNTKNEYIENILLYSNVKKYNDNLYNKGILIQNELKHIYDIVALKKQTSVTNCSNFRKLLKSYYIDYFKINPYIDKINWTTSQNDYFEIFNIFNYIFDIPNDLHYMINNNIEYRSFIDVFPIDDLISNKTIYVDKYYPKRENIITFDDINDINYGKIIKEKIEYLKTPILFIYFNRNFNNVKKLNTTIIPSLKLKLKHNNFNLYLNSIIIHLGDVNGGHYITLYECKGLWYKYDDLLVKEELIGTFNDIINNNLYLQNLTGLYYF